MASPSHHTIPIHSCHCIYVQLDDRASQHTHTHTHTHSSTHTRMELLQRFLRILHTVSSLPCCFMYGIANPLDEISHSSPSALGCHDTLYFPLMFSRSISLFFHLWCRPCMWGRSRGEGDRAIMIWFEARDVDDRVDTKQRRESQFIRICIDCTCDWERAKESLCKLGCT